MRERQQDLTARELSFSLVRDSEQQEPHAVTKYALFKKKRFSGQKSLMLFPQLPIKGWTTFHAFSGHSQQLRY